MLADVAEDILVYIELTQLQNHILALDDPTLHPILQVPHKFTFIYLPNKYIYNILYLYLLI